MDLRIYGILKRADDLTVTDFPTTDVPSDAKVIGVLPDDLKRLWQLKQDLISEATTLTKTIRSGVYALQDLGRVTEAYDAANAITDIFWFEVRSRFMTVDPEHLGQPDIGVASAWQIYAQCGCFICNMLRSKPEKQSDIILVDVVEIGGSDSPFADMLNALRGRRTRHSNKPGSGDNIPPGTFDSTKPPTEPDNEPAPEAAPERPFVDGPLVDLTTPPEPAAE